MSFRVCEAASMRGKERKKTGLFVYYHGVCIKAFWEGTGYGQFCIFGKGWSS